MFETIDEINLRKQKEYMLGVLWPYIKRAHKIANTKIFLRWWKRRFGQMRIVLAYEKLSVDTLNENLREDNS